MQKRRLNKIIKGRDPTSQLYRAVIRWIKSKGGSILVIGGGRNARVAR